MALTWKPGEGYDIHVLRGGPASKSLAGALNLPPNADASTLKFEPEFDGAPFNLRVRVRESTGEVTAMVPPPNTSQIEIHNFLIRASVRDSAGTKHETVIRVHVHDVVKDIWLTPRTLTIRKDADSCRFTVLAAFTDGTIGDITEWPTLSYQSLNPGTNTASSDVRVGANGVLTTVNADKSAEITVTVTLPPTLDNPPSLTSGPSRVLTKPGWISAAMSANVTFVVSGLRLKADDPERSTTVVPNKADANSSKRDSVASVVANATNILFISEGFSREIDFTKVINKIVEDLRTQDSFQPFKLLQDSINYWSVFVPSQEDGTTLLGAFAVNDALATATLAPLPQAPSSSSQHWSVAEMTHEVGLPIFDDAQTLNTIQGIWSTRYGNKAYATLAATNFVKWRELAEPPRTRLAVLNELDSAFGMRNYDRPRATPSLGRVSFGADPRRTRDVDIFKFVENIRYGGHNIGATWIKGGKDAGFICFICFTEKQGGHAWGGYFLISTGRAHDLRVKARPTARGAVSIQLDTPPVSPTDQTRLASVVSHEFGHLLGLADEYGDGRATHLDFDHSEPNLLAKFIITSQSLAPPPQIPRTVYDKTAAIKWLWPRLTKAALVTAKPQGAGRRFKVKVQKGHGKPFKLGDIVRFRLHPVRLASTQDAIFNFPAGFHLIVTSHTDDEVEFGLGQPGGILHDLEAPVAANPNSKSWREMLSDLFKPDAKYTLVCPLRVGTLGGGSEVKIVADSIRGHIAATHAPLNAPAGSLNATHETAVCKANYSGLMTPTNLPGLLNSPRNGADIIGIYEGGGGHDCGVFRPAGRCKMRQSSDASIPFCFVCRYVMVDRLDPSKHGELDRLYPVVSP